MNNSFLFYIYECAWWKNSFPSNYVIHVNMFRSSNFPWSYELKWFNLSTYRGSVKDAFKAIYLSATKISEANHLTQLQTSTTHKK